MDPAWMIVESLTSDPEIREQNRHQAYLLPSSAIDAFATNSCDELVPITSPRFLTCATRGEPRVQGGVGCALVVANRVLPPRPPPGND